MRKTVSGLALACALAAGGPALAAGGHPGGGQLPSPYDDPSLVGQTSDGVVSHARPLPAGAPPPPTARRTTSRRALAPGVVLTRFALSSPRPNRALLLTVDLRRTRVGIDYTAQPHVSQVAPIVQTLRADPQSRRVVAGVNGDFYDIGDTGAPLGLGKDRQRGLLHGPLSGWNSAFYVDRDGRAHVGTLAVHTSIGQHPRLRVTNLNSPYVAVDGIGVYTPAWGPSPGDTVTAGSSRDVRVVATRRGRVVATSRTFSPGRTIGGALLVGRGAGARALARLHVGDRAPVRSTVDGNPQAAISGNLFLLRNGVVTVVEDGILAPRTAVGVDSTTGEVLILEVDGRQRDSRGMSYLEVANLMADLGATDALNLDGGGSSTVVARDRSGGLSVVNTPSDGFQRRVADGLMVTYRRPR